MLVKTSDLIGPALDWAVAKAEGHQPLLVPTGRTEYSVGVITAMDDGPKGFACCYSTDWSQGGPLIEKHVWALPQRATHRYHLGAFEAYTPGGFPHNGDTPLIAACRAIVAAELGDQVDVPDELMQS